MFVGIEDYGNHQLTPYDDVKLENNDDADNPSTIHERK
jgi:hypothetical protein